MDSDESLDKVDDSDQVIGTTSKEEAHDEGYVHRVAVVYVFNPNGELIVQQIGKNKLYDHSVGGHVVKNETYDAAVKREAYEELNIQGPFSFLGKIYSDESAIHNNFRHIYAIYRSYVANNWNFIPNNEVKHVETMTLRNITSLMSSRPGLFTAGFINTMIYYLDVTKSDFHVKVKSLKADPRRFG
jgi:isopentenyldiphosphate isomerase